MRTLIKFTTILLQKIIDEIWTFTAKGDRLLGVGILLFRCNSELCGHYFMPAKLFLF